MIYKAYMLFQGLVWMLLTLILIIALLGMFLGLFGLVPVEWNRTFDTNDYVYLLVYFIWTNWIIENAK